LSRAQPFPFLTARGTFSPVPFFPDTCDVQTTKIQLATPPATSLVSSCFRQGNPFYLSAVRSFSHLTSYRIAGPPPPPPDSPLGFFFFLTHWKCLVFLAGPRTHRFCEGLTPSLKPIHFPTVTLRIRQDFSQQPFSIRSFSLFE